LIEREIDGGVQRVEVPNVSILTCDLRLNTPRFPKLPAILKAKKKPIEKLNLEDFQSEFDQIQSSFVVEKVEDPPKRQGGVILESVDELLDKLRNVDKVL
jgi:electron transfer flavoprotein beta subunit